MKREWYNLEAASDLLGTDVEGVKYLIVTRKLRAGILAKRWLGIWTPPRRLELVQAEVGEANRDQFGDLHKKTPNIWHFKDGEKNEYVKLRWSYAELFWYLPYRTLENLLVISGTQETDVSVLFPTAATHNDWLKGDIPKATAEGYFWVPDTTPNRRISIDDLLIHADDIPAAIKDKHSKSAINVNPRDLRIEFLQNNMLNITISDKTRRVSCAEFGLIDNRTGGLNKSAILLLGIAKGRKPEKQHQKDVSQIRGILKGQLGIHSDPFQKDYKPLFTVVDGRGRADQRAQDNARTVTYDDNAHSYPFADEDDEAGEFLKTR